jgi:8-oxo-dGTP diphosphatase
METSASPVNWEEWRGEILATLLFVIRDGEILLIEKKRGIGAGKVNGPGGKIDPGETPLECALRETMEELHVKALRVSKRGELCFAMSDIPDIHCHVFVAEDFEGEPTETDEAIPLWTSLGAIPYDRMWADDIYWLPQMIDGQTFRGRFLFEGETILWRDVQFGVEFESE